MSVDQSQLKNIQHSIRLIQRLRSGVGQVFKDLSDGISEYVEESKFKCKNENEQTSSTSTTGEKSEEQNEKQQTILRKLKKSLESISYEFSDLEKTSTNIGPVQTNSNIDNLSLDPVEKNVSLHTQILKSYKWTNKMHEHAQHAETILSQNYLKRTQVSRYSSAKKPRTSVLVATLIPPATVDQLFEYLNREYSSMNISVVRPFGNSAIVQIEIGRTMRAIIALRGLMIEWVKVKGFDETFKTEDGQLDIWSTSRYKVFQTITDHAVAASLHYYAPLMPEIAIKSFMMWFQGYSSLFSAPCKKCGRYLNNNMPPTWRNFRSIQPYHDACRV